MAPRTILGVDRDQAQQFGALAAVRECGEEMQGRSFRALGTKADPCARRN